MKQPDPLIEAGLIRPDHDDAYQNEAAFQEARSDIVDQVADTLALNKNLGNYSFWLEKILDRIKDLRRKDFF